VLQHFLGFAAQEQAGESAPAVGGHENQVAAAVRRGFDDAFVGDVAGRRQFIAGYAGFLAEAGRRVEDFLRLRFGQFGEFLRRRGVDEYAFTIVGDGVLGLGVEGGDFRADFLGKRDGVAHRILRKLGTVGGNKDVLEHFILLLIENCFRFAPRQGDDSTRMTSSAPRCPVVGMG
jgi:hypothetical protein